jgi:putative transposase
MSKSKHSEAQIIGALKQVEAGRSVEDVARDQGVSKHTIYAWKSKYGGMEVSEAQEVKQLRDENARLKKLVADPSLDKDMLESATSACRSTSYVVSLDPTSRWPSSQKQNLLMAGPSRLEASFDTRLKSICLTSSTVATYYSQRNTFPESAVQITNTRTSATRSPACADHASPFKIPWSSETA